MRVVFANKLHKFVYEFIVGLAADSFLGPTLFIHDVSNKPSIDDEGKLLTTYSLSSKRPWLFVPTSKVTLSAFEGSIPPIRLNCNISYTCMTRM